MFGKVTCILCPNEATETKFCVECNPVVHTKQFWEGVDLAAATIPRMVENQKKREQKAFAAELEEIAEDFAD